MRMISERDSDMKLIEKQIKTTLHRDRTSYKNDGTESIKCFNGTSRKRRMAGKGNRPTQIN